MSIEFRFTGRVKDPDALRADAERLAKERRYGFYQWQAPEKHEAGLSVFLCPLGGDLRVRWEKKPGLFGKWAVDGICVSTPAGPGLHKAAVELLDGLDIQNLAVEDETEYYQHRDFERMCREHFYPWLSTIVDVFRQKQGELNSICICWDLDQYMPEDVPGTVITPVGRFSIQWMRELLEQKGVEALAERFFLWYHAGERDALYYRAAALNLLWEQCYFAPSSRSEEDKLLNNAICDDLETAARLDPALPLPRKAYAEVCALAGRPPVLPDGPELESEFQPGFRKGLVTFSIGPLRLTLPGRYQFDWEEWDETTGCHLWSDGDHPIWRVSGYKKRQGDAAFTPVLQDDNDVTEFPIQNGAVRWGWRAVTERECAYFQARAEVITGPSLFLITVSYTQPEQLAEIGALMEKITVNVHDVEKHTIQAHSLDQNSEQNQINSTGSD